MRVSPSRIYRVGFSMNKAYLLCTLKVIQSLVITDDYFDLLPKLRFRVKKYYR
ncbi:hypothetical protein Hanom_Chr05g00469601 [Helianthus anomalus]